MKSDKIWPYSISGAIFLIFIASIVTVFISLKSPVAESELYMMNYHEADDKANDIINKEIAFNKAYSISYITDSFKKDALELKYKIVDTNNQPVDGAKFKIVLTRPDTTKDDIVLESYSVSDGIYSFSKTSLPKDGRWDVLAKVSIGDKERYLNIKTSTTNQEVIEF